MTADEYHRLIETGMFGGLRVELRDGEVSPMSPMNPAHASALTRISRLFNALFDEKSASIRLQCPVALDEEWEPHPDLVVAIPEEWEHAHPRAADIHLIIEVSDSSVREDLVRKIPRYAKTGVAEVWVIDLTAEIVHVHRSPDPTGHYLTEFDAKIGDELSIVAFPGSTVPATRLFPMSRANKPAKR
jgi:Uma2 family endonuclease